MTFNHHCTYSGITIGGRDRQFSPDAAGKEGANSLSKNIL